MTKGYDWDFKQTWSVGRVRERSWGLWEELSHATASWELHRKNSMLTINLPPVFSGGNRTTNNPVLTPLLISLDPASNSCLPSAKGFKGLKVPPYSVPLAVTKFSPAPFGKTFYIVIFFPLEKRRAYSCNQQTLCWKCWKPLMELRPNDFWNVDMILCHSFPQKFHSLPHSPLALRLCTSGQLIMSASSKVWAPRGHGIVSILPSA